MKKKSFVLLLITIVVVLVGCTIGKKDKGSLAGDWNLEQIDSNFLQEINKIIKEGKPVDLVRFLDINMIRMRTDELNEGVYLLNEMQKSNLNKYNKFLDNKEYQNMLSRERNNIENISFKSDSELEEKCSFIENEELRGKIIEAYGGNYKLYERNNTYEFILDYDRYDKYENNILSELKTYLDIQKNDQCFMDNEDFSFNNLGEKLISIEEHLQTYSGGLGYEDLLRMYSKDLRIFMEGTKELPIVDEENKIKSDVLEAYKSIVAKDSITSEVLKDYLKNIEESEGMMTEKVMESVLTIHNNAIALLER